MAADFIQSLPKESSRESELNSSGPQIWANSSTDMRDMRSNPARRTDNSLPQFEIVQNRFESPTEHQEMVHKFAAELLSGRMTNDVRQYLTDKMYSGGPNALNQASREINEEMTRLTKGLPEPYQLRLIYSASRDRQTGERFYSVTLQRHRDSHPLDGITFKSR